MLGIIVCIIISFLIIGLLVLNLRKRKCTGQKLKKRKITFLISSFCKTQSHSKHLKICALSIRRFHPSAKIVVCDDHSVILPHYLLKTGVIDQIIKNPYQKTGEYGAFCLASQQKCDCVIYVHDSIVLRRPFTDKELQIDFRFMFHALKSEWMKDNCSQLVDEFIPQVNKKLQKAWMDAMPLQSVAFGAMSIGKPSQYKQILNTGLNRPFWREKLNTKKNRKRFERLIALAAIVANVLPPEPINGIFGCIHHQTNAFSKQKHILYDQNSDKVNDDQPAVYKYWAGR